jgi:hypothetical membrane protein
MRWTFKHAWPVWAVICFLLAMAAAGIGVPEYSHRVHPLALRGASGLPGAMLFNVAAFVLPGALLLLAAQQWRQRLDGHPWRVRIGWTLMQLSALAFALQGVMPMDMRGLDQPANRLHALAWMLWWMAFVAGATVLTLAGRQRAGWARGTLTAAMSVLLLAVLVPIGAWVGLAQRLAFLVWFGWWLLMMRAFSRSAASGPGSSPPAQR